MQIPQTAFEQIVSQLDWVHKNINNNLDFVPAAKLNWKPAPEAKSVLEIIDHATNTVHRFTAALAGTPQVTLTPATDADSAKKLVTQVITAHQQAVKSLTPEQAEEKVTTPIGELTKGAIAGLPVVELFNHHGQITYIETLLGDSESHLIFA